jgi:hypothetical protein
MAVRLSAYVQVALYLQEESWYSFLRAIVWLEGLDQLINPMTLRIELPRPSSL